MNGPLSSEGVDDANLGEYRRNVRADHYLQKAAFWAAVLFTWHLHGFWAALAAAAVMFGLVFIGNLSVMAMTGSLRALRVNRWLWPILLLAGLWIFDASSTP